MYNMLSTKTRAMVHSSKPQASSIKPQAASIKLDKSSGMGYYRIQGYIRDGMAIDICKGPLMGPRNSAAEILQVEQHKYPGDRSRRNCRIMVPDPRTSIKKKSNKLQATSFKHQATSIKRQARSFKLKATSNKLQDSRA